MRQLQLLALFCARDDCCKHCDPLSQQGLLQAGQRHRPRTPALTLRARMPILVSFPWSPSRTLQHASTASVVPPLRPSGPRLGSATRGGALLPRVLVPLCW
jgi:hypothetical protein